MTTSASSNSSSWLETYNPAKGRPALVLAEQWKPLRSCVLEAIAPLSHLSPSSLSPFLRALINVSLYVRANHQELSVSWILSPQVLATYSKAKGVTHDDLGRLRRLAGLHHLSTNEAHPRGASRQHYHRPYSGDEVTALLRAADALSTDNRQINATVLILLGAGCGLTRQNATEVTADSLHLHGDALFVAAPKHCAKVRVCFEDELRALVTRRPEGRLRGTMSPEHVLESVRRWLAKTPGLPAFSIDRLRATYLCALLEEGAGLLDLLAWTGMKSPEAFDGYLGFVARDNACPLTEPKEGVTK